MAKFIYLVLAVWAFCSCSSGGTKTEPIGTGGVSIAGGASGMVTHAGAHHRGGEPAAGGISEGVSAFTAGGESAGAGGLAGASGATGTQAGAAGIAGASGDGGMPGVGVFVGVAGASGSAPIAFLSAQQLAQELASPTEKTHLFTLGDSRWAGMSAFIVESTHVQWVGRTIPASAYDQASHDVEATTQTAGDPPANTLTVEVPDWLPYPNFVVEFTGTSVSGNDLFERLCIPTSDAFSLANTPILWGRLLGNETLLRGWVYGLNGKVTSSPGIGLWWRADNAVSYTANAPGSGYYDYAGLGAGEYAEVSLTRAAGWTSSNDVVAMHWTVEGGAATSAGEFAAMSQTIIELNDVGIVHVNWAVGGAHLDTHFLDTDAFPPERLSVFAPLLGENRIWHIDLGTNGGDADGDFLDHAKQLVALCRVENPTAAVIVTTAYDASTDAGEKAYVADLYQLAREVGGVVVLDTRSYLPAYAEGVVAGYYGDTVHYNDSGRAALAAAFDAMVAEVVTSGAYHMGYLGTDLTIDPLQVGVEFELSGVGTVGSLVVVTVNGEAWGSTTCASDGRWSITNTPTAAMRGAGTDVDVVVTVGPTRSTTRPTTIAAAA